MKTSKTRFIQTVFSTILCFFVFSPTSTAQLEAGVYAGATNYQGDLADGTIIWRETQLSYGALLRYTANRFVSLRAHFIQGNLQASDYNSSRVGVRQRGFRLRSVIREISTIGEFTFLGIENNTANDFSFMVTPYLFGGLGIAITSNSPIAPPDRNPYPFPEVGAKNTFLTVPLGIGVKIQPSPSFSLGLEWGARTVFSDRLDGVSNVSLGGGSIGNDWYMFGGLTFTYIFNSQN
ncbi:MAG: DUF6089 family protein [Saprospiraceae bacterium]|nr:DUF6089 family protein [Saprospiraceae bacterium]